jgi:uncharacterized membrane protein
MFQFFVCFHWFLHTHLSVYVCMSCMSVIISNLYFYYRMNLAGFVIVAVVIINNDDGKEQKKCKKTLLIIILELVFDGFVFFFHHEFVTVPGNEVSSPWLSFNAIHSTFPSGQW